MRAQRLFAPRPGSGVCPDCRTFIEPCFERCRVCERMRGPLAAFVPIAYSVHGGELHRDIASYKRDADPSVDATAARLGVILQRFILGHERCVAKAAGVERFDRVVVVPSGQGDPDGRHPLATLISQHVPAVADRATPILRRTTSAVRARHFDTRRFAATVPLGGEAVLVIDDMWTSGANAQSAAAALLDAGASTVAAVAIGRHLRSHGQDLNSVLSERAMPLDFSACAVCVASDAWHPDAGRSEALLGQRLSTISRFLAESRSGGASLVEMSRPASPGP